jgi:hypothetical protein
MVSGQPYAPAALTPREEPTVTYDKSLCGPQDQSGHCRTLAPTKIKLQSFCHPARSLVTTSTELSYTQVYFATLPV